MSTYTSFRVLLSEYEDTKRELGNTEVTIRRITGRDPEDFSNGVPGSSKYRQRDTSRTYSGRKRPLSSYISSRKEEVSSESSYESLEEEDEKLPLKKPTLQSTVVAKQEKGRSRKATIEVQNINSKIKARNRRMFGALIGTLEKFQHEERKRQHKDSRRAEIEQKVEAATEEEREKIKKEKEQLFVTRREKQTQLRCLEKKIERAAIHESYELCHRFMQKFIKTKTKPCIFFLPATHTATSKKLLVESRNKIQELIKKKRLDLESDLLEIEECYKKDSLPDVNENGGRKDESDSRDNVESESESLVVEQEDLGLDNENSNTSKNVGSADQDFEPIYD